MDRVSKSARSRIMKGIKSKGNKTTEIQMAKILRQYKLKGWRRHYPIIGTPDFCWVSNKVALFVDGCFWHGCPTCYSEPSTNKKYWIEKINNNKRRDRRVANKLRKDGWAVIRVWECKIGLLSTLRRIQRSLNA